MTWRALKNETNFPTEQAVIEEGFIAQGIMRFPDDLRAANSFSKLLRESWCEEGQPSSDWKGNRLLETLEADAKKRISKGYSAGLVCHFLHCMVASGTRPSLNKASFLVSESALKNGPLVIVSDGAEQTRQIMTDPKKIAQNFRRYRPSCHYWRAALVRIGHMAETAAQDTRYRLHVADAVRLELCASQALGASEWGMRVCPEGLVYSSISGPGYPTNWGKGLEEYRNPNWGHFE